MSTGVESNDDCNSVESADAPREARLLHLALLELRLDLVEEAEAERRVGQLPRDRRGEAAVQACRRGG